MDGCKLPKSIVANTNILCLVRFGSGQNKLVQLLLRAQNILAETVQTLVIVKKQSK